MTTIPFKEPAFGYFPRDLFTEEVRRRMVDFKTNIALFAPRRRGKTTWVLLELQHAAAAWGLGFVYINLWANRSDPVGVLAKGLEIGAGLRPDDGSTRELSTELSAGLFKLGARKTYPKVTGEHAERIATAMRRIASARQTLLVIDEFQAIAEADKDAVAIGALRTALEHHGDTVVALFTGSERSTLAKMFKTKTAPLLDQAKLIDLPELEQDFVQDRLEGFQQSTTRKLELRELQDAYHSLGKSPLLLNEALTEMAVRPSLSLADAVSDLIEKRGLEEHGVQVNALPNLDFALLKRIADERKPYGDLDALTREAGSPKPVTVPTAQAAVKRLEKKGLIEQRIHHKTGWVIPDPLLERWVKRVERTHGSLSVGLPASTSSSTES